MKKKTSPNLGNDLPRLGSTLPELVDFVSALVVEYRAGGLSSWTALREKVMKFFTPEMMYRVDRLIPGWKDMSADADGVTLVHVVGTLLALKASLEYASLSARQQELCEWVLLLHDLGKRVQPGKHDHAHAFRSAALAVQALHSLGFTLAGADPGKLQAWADQVLHAVVWDDDQQDMVQDHRQLPGILAGMDDLCGNGREPSSVIKTILLHASIRAVKAWPPANPLEEAEILSIVDEELFPLLKVMMLADSDAWALFNQVEKERQRGEILQAFDEIASLCFLPPMLKRGA